MLAVDIDPAEIGASGKLESPNRASILSGGRCSVSAAICVIIVTLIGAMVESVRATEPTLPPITGAAAIVIDRDSGLVLGVKNPDERRGMASTTKMMTALLAIEQRSHGRLLRLYG